MEPTRVLIVGSGDSSPTGIASILKPNPDITVVAQVCDSSGAAKKACELKPQVIALDMSASEGEDLKTISQIRKTIPAAKVVVLTDEEDEDHVFSALSCGVLGYLTRSSSNSEIAQAMKRVAEGEVVISPSVAVKLLQWLRERANEPKLSHRETDVLRLLGEGLKNREIASRLIVSESTVRTYIYRLQEKLGLKSRLDISIYAGRRHARPGPVTERLKKLGRPLLAAPEGSLTDFTLKEPATSKADQGGPSQQQGSATGTVMLPELKLGTSVYIEFRCSARRGGVVEAETREDTVNECRELVAKEIQHHGGTVTWFTSSGLMTLFGAPISDEHSPQKALQAALAVEDIVKGLNDQLSVRDVMVITGIGINTGIVLIEQARHGMGTEFKPLANTTELAAKAQEMADAGGIVVTENTFKLSKNDFVFVPMGEMQPGPKEAPVRVYKLKGLKEPVLKLHEVAIRKLTRFVGRDKEIEALKMAFSRVKSGSAQVVGIVGEAGVGKSRLLFEFVTRLAPGEFLYLEGSCRTYGTSAVNLPILQIVRQSLDIENAMGESEVKKRIMEKITHLGMDPMRVVPPLQEFLGLSVDDEHFRSLESPQKKEMVFEAIGDILHRHSQEKAILIAIEDCQQIDKTSEEFLGYLVDSMPLVRMMLLLLYRPEYQHAWATRSYYQHIGLSHLTRSASAELVQSILGGPSAPELIETIVSKAGGNPLFVEELIHALLENGRISRTANEYILAKDVRSIDVPASVQEIIAARLDRLGAELKLILQTASIIGVRFSLGLLQIVLGTPLQLRSHLQELLRSELIYKDGLEPQSEYVFKHTLIQEAIYRSLPLKTRKKLHEKIGGTIERLYSDGIEDYYELLGYHYAKSDAPEKAYEYLKLSGDKAAQIYSNWEAVNHYREALDMLNLLSDTEKNKRKKLELCLAVELPLRSLGYPEGSLAMLREGERIATEFNEQRSLAVIYSGIGLCYSFHGDVAKGKEYTELCLEKSEEIQDIDLIGPVAFNVCSSYVIAGQHQKLAEVVPNILALIEKNGRQSDCFGGLINVYTALLTYYSLSLGLLGDFVQAEQFCQRAISEARKLDNPYNLATAETIYGFICLDKGEGEAALMHVQSAAKYTEESGIEPLPGLHWMQLGHAYHLLGRTEEAKTHLERALEIFQEGTALLQLSQCHYCLSLVHFDSGDLTTALKYAKDSIALADKNGEKLISADSRVLLGRILGKVTKAGYREAENCILQAIKDLRRLKAKSKYAQAYLYLGELYTHINRRKEALRSLKNAERLFLGMGVDYWLRETQIALAKL